MSSLDCGAIPVAVLNYTPIAATILPVAGSNQAALTVDEALAQTTAVAATSSTAAAAKVRERHVPCAPSPSQDKGSCLLQLVPVGIRRLAAQGTLA